jgi:hypothetical protein
VTPRLLADAASADPAASAGPPHARRAYPTGVLTHFGGALFAAWVPTLAWDWDSLAAAPSAGPGRAASGPAGCWRGRSTRGWPGGWPAPAAPWCWPRLSLVTWVVLGWRTATVEAGAADTLVHVHPDAGSAAPGERASPSRRSVSVPNQYQGPRMPGPPRRTVLKVLKPGMELLLFRLGDRGYTSPRERVREVVATRTGRSASWSARWSGCCATTPRPVCPRPPRPSGYVRASFQTLGASWLLIDWNAIRLPTGMTAPR